MKVCNIHSTAGLLRQYIVYAVNDERHESIVISIKQEDNMPSHRVRQESHENKTQTI